jgi:hypothetical protein
MTRTVIAILMLAALTGCGTTRGAFENRLTTTLDGCRAFVTSLYGPIGITAELAEADARELRRLLAARACEGK